MAGETTTGRGRRSPALRVVTHGKPKMKPGASNGHKANGARAKAAFKEHIRDLNITPIQRYVGIQRARGALKAIGKVDVDLEQVVSRRFLCDRHRCIQWTPHTRIEEAEPIIDRSCCARYDVPVMDLDREKLEEILPLVKKRLAKDHPLVEDPSMPVVEIDEEEYHVVMRPLVRNVCQFVLYDEGRTACAIHKTCLEEGLPVAEYKPIGCSLWPVALVDYDDDGEERYLLTAYSDATNGLFEASDDHVTEEDHFACLLDKQEHYEPLYKNVEGILTYLLGGDFWRSLEREAKRWIAAGH